MIIVPELDIFLNQLILDYFSNFDVNQGLSNTAKIGHKELVDYFINKGANHWNYGMFSAAQVGHKDLVDFFISKGADCWNLGMLYAGECGHTELEEFFLQKIYD